MKDYLTPKDFRIIEDAFVSAGEAEDYLDNRKTSFLIGINNDFCIKFMGEICKSSFAKLQADLLILSKHPRLIDGTVPLIQWLKNVMNRFEMFPEVESIKPILKRVEAESTQYPLSTKQEEVDIVENEDSELFAINQEFYSLWLDISVYGGFIPKDKLKVTPKVKTANLLF